MIEKNFAFYNKMFLIGEKIFNLSKPDSSCEDIGIEAMRQLHGDNPGSVSST